MSPALRSWIASSGVDIVLDYVWGAPAQAALAALAQKGLSKAAPRVRYVQIGSMAGATIPLDAGTLRSFPAWSCWAAALAARVIGADRYGHCGVLCDQPLANPFQTQVKTVQLRDVEALWNSRESATRMVFSTLNTHSLAFREKLYARSFSSAAISRGSLARFVRSRSGGKLTAPTRAWPPPP